MKTKISKWNLVRQVLVAIALLAGLIASERNASAQIGTVQVVNYDQFWCWANQNAPLYDNFNACPTQHSIVNSYLLCRLSMGIYTSSMNEYQLRNDLEEMYEPLGLTVKYVFMNPWTGTEGAVFTNDNVVIVVFRGTSSAGTPYYTVPADYLGDADDDMRYVTVAGKSFYVHKGFWHNVDSEYHGIRNIVRHEYNEGKSVFVTGHSLGGANATLMALRLHYESDIDVEGLVTFGAPKVGDSGMKATCQGDNKNGKELEDATTRWCVHGDPAPTFWQKALVWSWGAKKYFWNYYTHFGTVNRAYRQSDGSYNVYYNTSTSQSYNSIWNLWDEHMAYEDATEAELIEQGYGYLIND